MEYLYELSDHLIICLQFILTGYINFLISTTLGSSIKKNSNYVFGLLSPVDGSGIYCTSRYQEQSKQPATN